MLVRRSPKCLSCAGSSGGASPDEPRAEYLPLKGVGSGQRIVPLAEHPVQRREQLALAGAAVFTQQLPCNTQSSPSAPGCASNTSRDLLLVEPKQFYVNCEASMWCCVKQDAAEVIGARATVQDFSSSIAALTVPPEREVRRLRRGQPVPEQRLRLRIGVAEELQKDSFVICLCKLLYAQTQALHQLAQEHFQHHGA